MPETGEWDFQADILSAPNSHHSILTWLPIA